MVASEWANDNLTQAARVNILLLKLLAARTACFDQEFSWNLLPQIRLVDALTVHGFILVIIPVPSLLIWTFVLPALERLFKRLCKVHGDWGKLTSQDFTPKGPVGNFKELCVSLELEPMQAGSKHIHET